jgi:suppressor of ftsI
MPSKRRATPRGAGPVSRVFLLWTSLITAAACPAAIRASGSKAPAASVAAELAEPLTMPAVLANTSSQPNTVEVTITAAPAQVALVPGRLTNVFAFNGTVPGPTLEAREGDRVIVHFKNELKEPTNIHWHGMHVPVVADGGPTDPIPPGGSYDYAFTVPPGTAGTYWYHPHTHHQVGRQVLRGLFGAIIVRAADDPLPREIPEKLLILTDQRINSAGSIVIPSSVSDEQGWEGNLFFVNGQIRPTIPIRSGEIQRWRVINASVARFYRLSLGSQRFLQVGTDAGLFERPVERTDLLLAPAERAELLVTGSGEPGTQTVLQSLPYDRYISSLRPRGWDRPLDLLNLQVSAEPPISPPALPTTLRAVPALDPGEATATRRLVLREAMINGRFFDPNRVDISAPLGATEIWSIENRDDMDHPFHLHGFSFQVLDRNGVPEPFRAWKDTVDVPRHTTVRIIVEYRDYPGKRMFHCHIMDHEDYGMMGVLEVK